MKKTCACACVHKQNKTKQFHQISCLYISINERKTATSQTGESVCERVKTDLFFGYVCDGDSQAVDMIAARKKKHAY